MIKNGTNICVPSEADHLAEVLVFLAGMVRQQVAYGDSVMVGLYASQLSEYLEKILDLILTDDDD